MAFELRQSGPEVDALYAELLKAGDSAPRIRDVLARHEPDDLVLIALLRRAVPIRLLEHLGTTLPWSERPRVLGGVVRNPRAPRTLALRLLPSLFWRDLAEVAASPPVASAVRVRSEGLLLEMLPELRLGERIALGKVATLAVLPLLLADPEAKVARATLNNPRLREEDLTLALRQPTVPKALLEEVAASTRWRESYAVRLALVLQARTPLALALAQLSSLVERDLKRVAESLGLPPLVQAAALRLAGLGESRAQRAQGRR